MIGSKTKLKFYKDKLSGHRDTIVSIYSPQGPKGGILVSVSRDGRLKVWDLIERGYIVKRILMKAAHAAEDIGQKVDFGPMDMVESALFSEKTVYCGYSNGSIYGWNMKEGTLIYNFEGHDDAVTGLIWLTPDRFVSCSFDQTIIFWDVLVGVSTCVLKLDHEINQMHKLDNKLYLLINSRELVVVDIEAKEIDLRVEFSEHNITSIFAMKDFFLFGDTFSYLYVIKQQDLFKEDAKNPVLKKTLLQGHSGWILAMYVFHDFLFTCSDDLSIKVWSLPHFVLKDELLGHKNAVCCMTEANEYLYSGSYDLTIKNWNIDDMKIRIKIRDQLRIEEEYSLKAETYNAAMDAKKKKKKRSKSPAKASKPKTEALKKNSASAAGNIEAVANVMKQEATLAVQKTSQLPAVSKPIPEEPVDLPKKVNKKK